MALIRTVPSYNKLQSLHAKIYYEKWNYLAAFVPSEKNISKAIVLDLFLCYYLTLILSSLLFWPDECNYFFGIYMPSILLHSFLFSI